MFRLAARHGGKALDRNTARSPERHRAGGTSGIHGQEILRARHRHGLSRRRGAVLTEASLLPPRLLPPREPHTRCTWSFLPRPRSISPSRWPPPPPTTEPAQPP